MDCSVDLHDTLLDCLVAHVYEPVMTPLCNSSLDPYVHTYAPFNIGILRPPTMYMAASPPRGQCNIY